MRHSDSRVKGIEGHSPDGTGHVALTLDPRETFQSFPKWIEDGGVVGVG